MSLRARALGLVIILVAGACAAKSVAEVADAGNTADAEVVRAETTPGKEPTPASAAAGGAEPSLTSLDRPETPAHIFPLLDADEVKIRAGSELYPSVDLVAKEATLVVAPTDGVIEFMAANDGWDPQIDLPITRDGRQVSLLGDDGFRYFFAHLDVVSPGIEAGVRVDVGRPIGRVGRSGNARDFHLGFGITRRVDFTILRDMVEPYPVLRAWEAGYRTVSPAFSEHEFPVEPSSSASYNRGEYGGTAVDIVARDGAAFVAPTSGEIVSVQTVDAYDPANPQPLAERGLSVAMFGDDGFGYFGGHLDLVNVRPGVRVSAGQTLGRVGRTGAVPEDGPARVHFTITRYNAAGEGTFVDPAPVLDVWRRNTLPAVGPGDVNPVAVDGEEPRVYEYIIPATELRYSPGGHSYPATDMFAVIGVTVSSPVDGVVEKVSTADHWNPLVADAGTKAGLFVSILGDDGYRYYGSHMHTVSADIETGARVAAGQQIGTVGESGNAEGTDPHLHFDISVGDDWFLTRGEIDPTPALEAWRRGEGDTLPL